jgi:peroxiredoxin
MLASLMRRLYRYLFCPLAALALVLGSCQSPPAPAATAPDPGEQRAVAAGAHTIGTPAPAITVTTIDGDTIDLGKLYGARPVYLKLWATWCVPCREQMPGFERTFEAIGDRVTVIAVNTGLDDDADAVRAYRKKYGLQMPIVVDDGRLAAALDLQVTPQHVLIGRDARVAYVGHLDGDRLDRALTQAIAAPAPAAPVVGRPVRLAPALHPGDVVSGLRATTIDGVDVALGASHDGRPRALVMFSTYCESYFHDSLPKTSEACKRVRETVDQLAVRGDVDWLGIASGVWTSPESVVKYRAKTKIQIPLALDADGALLRAFGIHDVPTVVLIDASGKIARVVGPDDPGLAAAVAALKT